MRETYQKGFTLIEVILYTAIIGIVLFAYVNFALSVVQIRDRSLVLREVNDNARLAMDLMAIDIRRASDVVAPTEGNNSSTLTLDIPGPDNVVYSLSGSTLYRQVGANPSVEVTNSLVDVDSLDFENVTISGNRESVTIQITVSYAQADSVEYAVTKSYETSITRRR